MSKNSFVLYTDLGAHLAKLTDEEAGQLFKAVFRYQADGEIPDLSPAADMLFGVMCSQMDREAEKWEAVRQKRVEAANARYRRQREDEDAHASKSMQMHANAAVPVPVPVNVNVPVPVSVPVINNTDPAPAPDNTIKKPFGQYGHVMLTDAEVERIKMLRPNDWEAKVEYLDEYIERTGKQYRNHLLTIIKWAEEDDKKEAAARKDNSSVHFSLERRQTGDEDFFTDLFAEGTT